MPKMTFSMKLPYLKALRERAIQERLSFSDFILYLFLSHLYEADEGRYTELRKEADRAQDLFTLSIMDFLEVEQVRQHLVGKKDVRLLTPGDRIGIQKTINRAVDSIRGKRK